MAKRGRKPKKREWLLDSYVLGWLEGLGERTQENCVRGFDSWMPFIKMTPTEQIEKRLRDLQSTNPQERAFFEDKVLQYINTFDIDKLNASSVKTKVNRVMSFFRHNRVPLSFKRGEIERQIMKDRKGLVITKWVLNNHEARKIYGLADVRDRALFLMLYQSGFSEVDVSNLNVEDIPELYTNFEGHVNITKQRQKTKKIQKTCISAECLHDLRLYLMERGNPTEGALFESESGGERGQTVRKRLAVRWINSAMKNLCLKAFGTEKTKDFKTKNIRDAYGDALLRANLPQEIKDLLFGHKPQGARGNYQVSDETIKEAYEKAFEFLTVNHGTQSRKTVEELKAVVLGLSATVTEQQKHIEQHQETIDTIKRIMMFSVKKHRFLTIEAEEQCLKEITTTKKPLKQIIKKYAIPEDQEQTETD